MVVVVELCKRRWRWSSPTRKSQAMYPTSRAVQIRKQITRTRLHHMSVTQRAAARRLVYNDLKITHSFPSPSHGRSKVSTCLSMSTLRRLSHLSSHMSSSQKPKVVLTRNMGPEVMPLLENRDDINVGPSDLIALANDSCNSSSACPLGSGLRVR